MYRVKVHRDVEKFLRRIPKHDAERIREKILSLKDPFIVKPRKVKGEENTFRLRVGVYRILFFIDEEQCYNSTHAGGIMPDWLDKFVKATKNQLFFAKFI